MCGSDNMCSYRIVPLTRTWTKPNNNYSIVDEVIDLLNQVFVDCHRFFLKALCFFQVLHLIHERQNICEQIHLPAQSGSNSILENMRRGYSVESYVELVQHIREILPSKPMDALLNISEILMKCCFAVSLLFYKSLFFYNHNNLLLFQFCQILSEDVVVYFQLRCDLRTTTGPTNLRYYRTDTYIIQAAVKFR